MYLKFLDKNITEFHIKSSLSTFFMYAKLFIWIFKVFLNLISKYMLLNL
jgi:hypothetical protein